MPDEIAIAAGASVAFLVIAFLLGGFHHELAHRIRERRRGGYLIGGDQ